MAVIHRISKPYQIKAPPQLVSPFPLLLSYSIDLRSSRGGKTKQIKRLHVDMSGVNQADVLGVTSFIANLAKSMILHTDFEVQIITPTDSRINDFLKEIPLPRLLMQLGMNVNRTPDFWQEREADYLEPTGVESYELSQMTQTIIFIPKVAPSDREHTLKTALMFVKQFFKKNPSKSINYGQVGPILHEIVKNTLDHSEGVGLLALKVAKDSSDREILSFMHCEMGEGISLNVRDFLAHSQDTEEVRLAERGSTADFLHWAFTPGKSSKLHRGVNAGLGLATIRAAAKGGNIRVYCSDARSLAYITEFPTNYSHKQLRKRLYHSQPFPCFMYFGETQ